MNHFPFYPATILAASSGERKPPQLRRRSVATALRCIAIRWDQFREEQQLLCRLIDQPETEKQALCSDFHDGLITSAFASLLALSRQPAPLRDRQGGSGASHPSAPHAGFRTLDRCFSCSSSQATPLYLVFQWFDAIAELLFKIQRSRHDQSQ